MNYQLFDLINFNQLELLGFTQDYITFSLFLLILIAIYIVTKPVLHVISSRKYMFVLTYLFSSLLFIIGIAVYDDGIYLYAAFQVAVLGGFLLSIYLIYQFLKAK